MTTTAATTTEKTEEKTDKRRALGRGLDSLLPAGPRIVGGTAVVPRLEAVAADAAVAGDAVMQIPLDQIDENPYQTRTAFNSELLEELARSIQINGVVQPIVVRPGKNGRYILILGERRCRASKIAGQTTIPAMVRRVSDQQAAEMTIVENLQRQDLNCIEEATAYIRLSQDFGMTQEQISHRVGVSRETVANHLRVLKLPPPVIQHLQEGKLDFSEARVLLKLIDPKEAIRIADFSVQEHFSVAQLEEYVEGVNVGFYSTQPQPPATQTKKKRWIDPNVQAVQTELERTLGLRVQVKDHSGKGKIVIEYTSLEDFDRLVEMLGGKQ